MYKSRHKKGDRFGEWTLHTFINVGGNGEVWQATHDARPSEICAVKLLKRLDPLGYTRFRDEVKILLSNNDIKGLLPIIDHGLPEKPQGRTPFYVMPLATPLKRCISKKSPEQIIDIIICICQTLSKLHDRGISHRDIKPSNILVRDNEIFLGDFGLVEYPGKEDVTVRWKDVGARWTIAPEMRRDPDKADGKPADVYSLAKTLWILLTKCEQGFEGQYSPDSSIAITKFVPSIYRVTLDDLLHKCTEHEPTNRPTILEFEAELHKWKELNRNFEQRSKSEWSSIQAKLFPHANPKTVIWEDIRDMILILNIISSYHHVNHTLMPEGGGLDLLSAKSSNEEDCIEISLSGAAHVLKPKRLMFECFPQNSDWNYFRLEAEALEPICRNDSDQFYEGLTEIEPCVYSSHDCYDFNDFDGEILPASARPLVRILRGSLLICLRTGVYNSIPATYDGRHDKFNADDFRSYIEKIIRATSTTKEMPPANMALGPPKRQKPKFIKSRKIRKGSRFLNTQEVALINSVISLFQASAKERKELEQKYGLGTTLDFSDHKTLTNYARYHKEPKPNDTKFRQYLKSLSDGELALIEAVMYGGRDALGKGRAYPLDEMLVYFKKDNRQGRLHSITEKVSLDSYLIKGLESYK